MSIAWPLDRGTAETLRHSAGHGAASERAQSAMSTAPSDRSRNRPSLQLRCELTFAQPDAPEIAHAGVRVILVLIGPTGRDRSHDHAEAPAGTILTAADTSDASVIRTAEATTIEIPGLLTAVFRDDDTLAYIHTGLFRELGIPGGRCGVPTGVLRERT